MFDVCFELRLFIESVPSQTVEHTNNAAEREKNIYIDPAMNISNVHEPNEMDQSNVTSPFNSQSLLNPCDSPPFSLSQSSVEILSSGEFMVSQNDKVTSVDPIGAEHTIPLDTDNCGLRPGPTQRIWSCLMYNEDLQTSCPRRARSTPVADFASPPIDQQSPRAESECQLLMPNQTRDKNELQVEKSPEKASYDYPVEESVEYNDVSSHTGLSPSVSPPSTEMCMNGRRPCPPPPFPQIMPSIRGTPTSSSHLLNVMSSYPLISEGRDTRKVSPSNPLLLPFAHSNMQKGPPNQAFLTPTMDPDARNQMNPPPRFSSMVPESSIKLSDPPVSYPMPSQNQAGPLEVDTNWIGSQPTSPKDQPSPRNQNIPWLYSDTPNASSEQINSSVTCSAETNGVTEMPPLQMRLPSPTMSLPAEASSPPASSPFQLSDGQNGKSPTSSSASNSPRRLRLNLPPTVRKDTPESLNSPDTASSKDYSDFLFTNSKMVADKSRHNSDPTLSPNEEVPHSMGSNQTYSTSYNTDEPLNSPPSTAEANCDNNSNSRFMGAAKSLLMSAYRGASQKFQMKSHTDAQRFPSSGLNQLPVPSLSTALPSPPPANECVIQPDMMGDIRLRQRCIPASMSSWVDKQSSESKLLEVHQQRMNCVPTYFHPTEFPVASPDELEEGEIPEETFTGNVEGSIDEDDRPTTQDAEWAQRQREIECMDAFDEFAMMSPSVTAALVTDWPQEKSEPEEEVIKPPAYCSPDFDV